MGLISGTKKVAKAGFNVREWSNYDERKASWQHIGRMFKSLFVITQPTRVETFEEAVARLGLTEDDLKKRQSEFIRLAALFLLFGIGCFVYTVHLVWVHYFLAASLGGTVSLILFALAFRYHFWHFQTKHRKLGCTIKEWWTSNVNKDPAAMAQAKLVAEEKLKLAHQKKLGYQKQLAAPETASETVAETAPETASETAPETVAETAPETASETVSESTQQTTSETQPMESTTTESTTADTPEKPDADFDNDKKGESS